LNSHIALTTVLVSTTHQYTTGLQDVEPDFDHAKLSHQFRAQLINEVVSLSLRLVLLIKNAESGMILAKSGYCSDVERPFGSQKTIDPEALQL